MDREFEVIVYGATGFTGQLVAEYLVEHYPAGLNWAMAGRSLTKLREVQAAIGAPEHIPLIVADAGDRAALHALCQRTTVVLTTVGPYQVHGGTLLAAAVATGIGYVDLCGEPAWMRHMIDAHEAEAKKSGARIVFSCGFDSIPFDLGVFTLQERAKARLGQPVPRVKGRVRLLKGALSGGTVASARATISAAARDPGVVRLLTSPFALTPGFQGPHQPTGLIPEYDKSVGGWVAPFYMAPINTKNVHRTNFLLGHPYGEDFVYDEMMVAGLGDIGKAAAEAIAAINPFAGDKGPKPGEGPGKDEREAGHYDVLFIGEVGRERVECVVTGDRDPGYGSTSKMIAEAALCLAQDVEGAGGIWTPGALMGAALRDRLKAKAGLTFVAN